MATTEPSSKESCRKPGLTSGLSFKMPKWVTSTFGGHQSHATSTSSASLITSSRWSTTSRGITRSQRRMSFSKMSKTTSMSETSIHSTLCRLLSISKSPQIRMTERWKSNWLHSNKYSTCWKSSKVYSIASKAGLLHPRLSRLRFLPKEQQLKIPRRRKNPRNLIKYRVAHRGSGLWRTYSMTKLKSKRSETCRKRWLINLVRF